MSTLTKKALKELKDGGTQLEKKVINVLLNQGTTNDIKSYIRDVITHGCVSGIVSELIYHHDTLAFYNKYKNDIHNLLKESLQETGFSSPAELFGDKWEEEDPLADDTSNQNLLAWYGFEETVYRVASHFNLA